jgi:hypothetical protein
VEPDLPWPPGRAEQPRGLRHVRKNWRPELTVRRKKATARTSLWGRPCAGHGADPWRLAARLSSFSITATTPGWTGWASHPSARSALTAARP